MRLDFNDPMLVSIASATLVLHGAFAEKMRESHGGDDQYVYVPMRFPTGFYETLSSLMELDQLIGSMITTSIFMAGLESIIDQFNLRDSQVRLALSKSIKKHADEVRRERELENDLH